MAIRNELVQGSTDRRTAELALHADTLGERRVVVVERTHS
jgi:hypothetical protein